MFLLLVCTTTASTKSHKPHLSIINTQFEQVSGGNTKMSKSKKVNYFVAIIMLTSVMRAMACTEDYPDKARYDNYRLIRVHLETQEHVDLFQELEEESDSYTFYGHALNVNQDVTIMVAAHKIFEIQDLTQRYGIKYIILVSKNLIIHKPQ